MICHQIKLYKQKFVWLVKHIIITLTSTTILLEGGATSLGLWRSVVKKHKSDIDTCEIIMNQFWSLKLVPICFITPSPICASSWGQSHPFTYNYGIVMLLLYVYCYTNVKQQLVIWNPPESDISSCLHAFCSLLMLAKVKKKWFWDV